MSNPYLGPYLGPYLSLAGLYGQQRGTERGMGAHAFASFYMVAPTVWEEDEVEVGREGEKATSNRRALHTIYQPEKNKTNPFIFSI